MKIIFVIIMIIHGLIHMLGFLKAYNITSISQLNQPISKTLGLFWLMATVLFLMSVVIVMLENDYWILVASLAVIISQSLIIMTWQDAKFGTIPNIIVLIVLVLSSSNYLFKQNYQNDVERNFIYSSGIDHEILTTKAIEHLPMPVKKYLNYFGVMGKPSIQNFYAAFEGEMKDRKRAFPFISSQYNFFHEPSRLFFMEGKMFGINVPGYHKYMDKEASMDIKLFGLIPIVNEKSDVMFKSETVTTFAEMCFYAPSLLADKRISWEEIDDFTVKAIYTNKNTTITAMLHFNSEGQLVNFTSDDRYDISEMKQYKFSTPVSDYRNIEGYNIPTYAELIWHYPNEDFVYGKLRLKSIAYNLQRVN